MKSTELLFGLSCISLFILFMNLAVLAFDGFSAFAMWSSFPASIMVMAFAGYTFLRKREQLNKRLE